MLLKHLKPVGSDVLDEENERREVAEMQEALGMDFREGNLNRYDEITEAINGGDFKLAHRLTHSLKSNAGQIGKDELQKIAQSVEHILSKGEIPPADMMESLNDSLSKVLKDLTDTK